MAGRFHLMRCFCRRSMQHAAVAALRSSILLLLLLILTLFSSVPSFGQSQRYWIMFRDKGGEQVESQPEPGTVGISDHAMWRRSKVLPPGRLIDELDLPVNPLYIDQLQSAGIAVRSTSRWFNAVSAQLSADQQSRIASMPFVASIRPVQIFFRHQPEPTAAPVTAPALKRMGTTVIDYGPSQTQLDNIHVPAVHAQGITGAGVRIGMLDDGFNQHTVAPVLKNIKVIAEYDFVQRDSNTSRAPGEYGTQGNHGAGTLSVIGGYENGRLIGSAFGASFILAKTEIDSVEIQLEEDLFVEGLEWMERLGADVVSSSLGYNDWYVYSDFDGSTAITTRAARIAARKGVLLVTAMGNEGNYRDIRTHTTGTMIAPADADSIVSVGAVDAGERLAGFSSTGPTADDRTKPEVVAQGVSTYVMYGEGGYQYSNGTSFSTPLTAGVAALVLCAHPSYTPEQVRELLMSTAKPLTDSAAGIVGHPNNFYGWGMVDAEAAVGDLGGDVIPGAFVLHANYPNPFNGSTTILVDAPGSQQIEIAIYNLLGQKVRTLFTGSSRPGQNVFQWRDALNDAGVQVSAGVYFCRLSAPGLVRTQKILFVK